MTTWVESKAPAPPQKAAEPRPGPTGLVALRLRRGGPSGNCSAEWEICDDEDVILATPGENLIQIVPEMLDIPYYNSNQNVWFPDGSSGAGMQHTFNWHKLRNLLLQRYPELTGFRRILACPDAGSTGQEKNAYYRKTSPRAAYNWHVNDPHPSVAQKYVRYRDIERFWVSVMAADDTPYMWSDVNSREPEALGMLAAEVKRRGKVYIYDHTKGKSLWRMEADSAEVLAQLNVVPEQYKTPENIELAPDWHRVGWRLVHNKKEAQAYIKRREASRKAFVTRQENERKAKEKEERHQKKLKTQRKTGRVESYELRQLAVEFTNAISEAVPNTYSRYANDRRTTSDQDVNHLLNAINGFRHVYGEVVINFPPFRKFLKEWRYRRVATLKSRLYGGSREFLYWLDLEAKRLKITRPRPLRKFGCRDLVLPTIPKKADRLFRLPPDSE